MNNSYGIDLGAYKTRLQLDNIDNVTKDEVLSWVIVDEQNQVLVGEQARAFAKQHKQYDQLQHSFLKSISEIDSRKYVKAILQYLVAHHSQLQQQEEGVLVVPSYLTDSEKIKLKDIAKQEGLNIKEVISQGVAQATFLARDRRMSVGTRFSIYEWGASQFEFSIFEVIEEQQVKLIETESSIEISGYLLDEKIRELIATKYEAMRNSKADFKIIHALDEHIDNLKIGLNERQEYGVSLMAGARQTNIDVNTQEFVQAIDDLIDKSKEIVKRVLDKTSVKHIYFTGGVTQLYAVQQQIKESIQELTTDAYQSDMTVKGALYVYEYLKEKAIVDAQKLAQLNIEEVQLKQQEQEQERLKQEQQKAEAERIAEVKRQEEARRKEAEHQAALLAASQQVQQAEQELVRRAEEARRYELELERTRALQEQQAKKKSSTGKIVGLSIAGTLIGLVVLGIVFGNSSNDRQHANTEQQVYPAASAEAAEEMTVEDSAYLDDPSLSAEEDVAVAEPSETVNSPALHAGMLWNIKTVDLRNPKHSYDNVEFKVTGVDDGHYTFQKNVIGSNSSPTSLIYDKNLNLISGATGSYYPALTYYDFPLYVGKTWEINSTVEGNKFKDLQTSQGEVLGWETISSPYWGNITALKVQVVFDAYKDGELINHGLDVSWYSPELGRAIKSEEYNWNEDTQEWQKGREHYVINFEMP